MGSAERYEIAPITIPYGVTPTDLDLQQMQSFQVSPGVQKSRIRPGGSVDALAFMVGRGKPQITFSTRDLETALSQISLISGLCVTGPAIFRLLERDDCSVWTGGGVRYTAAGGGFVFPTGISGSVEDTDGVPLNCTFIPYWDGTNSPIEAVYVSDMSGDPAAAFGSQYYLGPVYRNAAEILGVTQHGYDTGLTVTGTVQTPGPYDRVTAITDRQGMFSYTTTKANAQLELFGECDTMSFYFQKGASCSDRVPYATSEHIKLSCAVGFIEVQDAGGDAAADALVNVQVSPVGPIAIDLASAIP